MTQPDNSRPIGNTPITDAAAATAPESPATDTTYPVDAPKVSSNADLRVGEDASDAAMSPTGADIDNDHADERPVNRSEDAPDQFDNREQADGDAQAQTVAEDARTQAYAEESEHGGRTNPAQIYADDSQDVVDHMQQMERSGRIDMGAYRGERNDDDEPTFLGEGGMEPGDLDEHGNPPRGEGQYTPVE